MTVVSDDGHLSSEKPLQLFLQGLDGIPVGNGRHGRLVDLMVQLHEPDVFNPAARSDKYLVLVGQVVHGAEYALACGPGKTDLIAFPFDPINDLRLKTLVAQVKKKMGRKFYSDVP